MEEGGRRGEGWYHRVEEEGGGERGGPTVWRRREEGRGVVPPCGGRVSMCSLTCSVVSVAVQSHLQCSVTCSAMSLVKSLNSRG